MIEKIVVKVLMMIIITFQCHFNIGLVSNIYSLVLEWQWLALGRGIL